MAMPQREPEVREERAVAGTPYISTGNFTLSAFFGLGALVLGIIALAGVIPVILSLIALLALGVAQWLMGLGLMGAADASLPVTRGDQPRVLPAGPVPKGIGAWFLGGSFAILLGIIGLIYGSAGAWVSVGVLLSALALFFGDGWSVVRGLAPGRYMRNLAGAGEIARGADLWGAVIVTLLAVLALPASVAVITGAPTAVSGVSPATAMTITRTATQALVSSAILLLGATLLVSGMLRAWAYRRVRV